MKLLFFLPLLGTTFIRQAFGLASTDEYRDADIPQSGYLPNHNMDPDIVDSAAFGLIWKVAFNSLEAFYAKPLTYTPLAGGPQLLFLASNMNYIRTLDAKTGALINSRQVNTPFLQSDIGCTDMPNYIGIAGTPTIDPNTDIVYFFSKTYIPNYRVAGATGLANGVYYFHAVNINTLADVYPPVLIDGTVADNDPQKYFVGGVILQRPSLTQIGNVVYGAFGGHCDLFNYTGVVIGVDVVQAKVVTTFATESGPLVPQTNVLTQDGGGGEGGIWMSGMGLVADGQRLFAVTGNGGAHENQGAPASGSSGCQTLGEAAINLAVDATTGALTISDYFQPYDYMNMDAGDQDYGSGGFVLLDPGTFHGTGVSKVAISAGKNGKVYILNADNLGGYKLGANQTDGNLQTIVTGTSSVFGAAGSYPGEGGYIYFTPVGDATYAYSFGTTSSGVPEFNQVAKTNEISAGRVGVGVPTVTSLNGEPGTAILWMTDPDVGLRAWYAVPQGNVLVNIPLPQVGGANKFQRPAFGDGRVYTTDSNGVLYCLGAPVNLPLNCTSPVDFGQVALGAKTTKNVTCMANIAITSVVGLELGSGSFTASNSSLPNGPLVAGASFTFPVTWDLTNTQASTPGVKSTPLTLLTVNGVAGYATSFPITLTGTEVSSAPFLTVTPSTVDFGSVVVTDPNNIPTIPGIFTIANQGLSNMTILGYAYTTNKLSSSPTFTNSTVNNGIWNLGYGFTATTLPAIGSIVPPSTSISVPAVFDPINGTGTYASYWQVWADGGTVNIILEGTAAPPPIANMTISDGNGGWLPESNLQMNFGNVAPGSTSSREIQICNEGGSSLEIDKSKPPNGVFRPEDPADFFESQLISPGQCANATVLFVANTEEYDLPNLVENNTWTLNTNDLTWGVHVIEISGTVVSTKVGPVNSTGSTVYNYLGCFAESTTGPRLFPNEPISPSPSMDNSVCQNACFSAGEYAFASTEFANECWCGNIPPPLASQDLTDNLCNFACPGDPNDRCGASGYLSVFYDPTKYVAGTNPALYGPQTVQQAGNYAYQGCYSEGTSGRALAALSPAPPSSGFTIELCAAACQGYLYFGMEYSNQCYCGNNLAAGSVNQTSSVPSTNGCSMLCTGNQLEYCGGPNRLDLYMLNSSIPTVTSSTVSPGSTYSTVLLSTSTTSSAVATPTGPFTVTNLPGYTYLGCYSEATNGRALSDLQNPIPATNVSVENCAAACAEKSYTYFGVEYAQECYCGNVINAGSVNQTSTIPSVNGCSLVCKANAMEYCGGSNRLNMYMVNPITISSSSSSSTSRTASLTVTISSSVASSSQTSTSQSSQSSLTSSSSQTSTIQSTSSSVTSSSSTPTPTGPITVTNLPGWIYLGCYSEATNTRALNNLENPIPAANVSVQACAVACSQYTYFGVEYAQECYCGNIINTGSVNQTSSTPSVDGCSMLCKANPLEYCGGSNRLNMYQAAPVISTSSSSIKSTSSLSSSAALSHSTLSSSSSSSLLSSSSIVSSLLSSTSASLSSSSLSSSTSLLISTKSLSTSSLSSSASLVTSTTSLSTSSRVLSPTTSATSSSLTSPSLSSSSSQLSSITTMIISSNLLSSTTISSSFPSSTTSFTSSPHSSLSLSFSLSTSTSSAVSTSSSSSKLSTSSSQSSSQSATSTNAAPLWTGTPTVNSKIGNWQYTGCANETSGARALGGSSYSSGTAMTIESCQAFCTANNYALAGLEYASQCYCANSLYTGSTVGQTGCNMACSGLNTELCGGGNRISLFNNTAYIYPSSPPQVGSYVLTGCYSESAGQRLLSGPSYTNTTGMTVESCVSFCAANGANGLVAGVEYAQECYCASTLPSTAVEQPLSSCNMLCKGNNKEFCGASALLDVYTYQPGSKKVRGERPYWA